MNDLESCREECELLKQKLRSSEENERREKECRYFHSCIFRGFD